MKRLVPLLLVLLAWGCATATRQEATQAFLDLIQQQGPRPVPLSVAVVVNRPVLAQELAALFKRPVLLLSVPESVAARQPGTLVIFYPGVDPSTIPPIMGPFDNPQDRREVYARLSRLVPPEEQGGLALDPRLGPLAGGWMPQGIRVRWTSEWESRYDPWLLAPFLVRSQGKVLLPGAWIFPPGWPR